MEQLNEESRKTAIANLHMLLQYATGEARPRKPDDPRVRYERVLAFLMTGACVADGDIQQLAKEIEAVLRKSPATQSVAA